ncbi:hypothetical protein ACSVBT_17930 [Afipia sp. TerB]
MMKRINDGGSHRRAKQARAFIHSARDCSTRQPGQPFPIVKAVMDGQDGVPRMLRNA